MKTYMIIVTIIAVFFYNGINAVAPWPGPGPYPPGPDIFTPSIPENNPFTLTGTSENSVNNKPGPGSTSWGDYHGNPWALAKKNVVLMMVLAVLLSTFFENWDKIKDKWDQMSESERKSWLINLFVKDSQDIAGIQIDRGDEFGELLSNSLDGISKTSASEINEWKMGQ